MTRAEIDERTRAAGARSGFPMFDPSALAETLEAEVAEYYYDLPATTRAVMLIAAASLRKHVTDSAIAGVEAGDVMARAAKP